MIEVKGLSKSYGETRAVKNVSFSIGRDQVVGFLGPNGAGKTTIMKILAGFHYPSEGTAEIDGLRVDLHPVAVKEKIGYLPENVPLYGDLAVDEYLRFVAEARLIPRGRREAAIVAAMEACGLAAMRSRRIETLSKGYRQRAGLAQAILHDPPILILDEPTAGLDPNQIIEIRALIKELGRRKTVLLSSHILQEVEAICSRLLIVNKGEIAAQGAPREIAGAMKGGETWELALKAALPAEEVTRSLCRLGAEYSSARASGEGEIALSFFAPAKAEGAALGGERIFDWAAAEGYKILSMNRKKISLEDIFVRLTSGDGGAEGEPVARAQKKGGAK
ncbi:MAG: ATP-binding cassette domain-containing protein [Treponema sp.]|nr:ATP-binding cassette domain-containing protein [Treponema sp.]